MASIFISAHFLLLAAALIDMSANALPRKFFWVIAVLFVPYAGILYLLLRLTVFRSLGPLFGGSTPPPVDMPPGTYNAPQQPPVASPIPPEIQRGEPYVAHHPETRAYRAFKTVGTILGVLAICAGVVVVGFMILLTMAMSSYGSNK